MKRKYITGCFLLIVLVCAISIINLGVKNTANADSFASEVVVTFNANNGDQLTYQTLPIGSKITKPKNPLNSMSTESFCGWFYVKDDIELVWDFNNNTVERDLTLYAKWENLECKNPEFLTQTLSDTKSVEFYMNTYENVEWFVNNEPQDVVGNTFSFTPPIVCDTYVIYCNVGGVKSKEYIVAVNYAIPSKINAFVSSVVDDNLYTFVIEDGEYYNEENFLWYCSETDYVVEAELLGSGATLTTRIEKDCKVFVVYQNAKTGEKIFSDTIPISPKFHTPIILYIIIIGAIVVLAVVVLLVWLSKKSYKGYY